MQWKPNTTVAAIAEQDGKFLLVEEKIDGKLVFNQPAGHLEHNESLIDAVIREVMEETAWEFEPSSLIGIYLYPSPNESELTYLRFCFHGKCIKHYPERKLDTGIVRGVWLSVEEIEAQKNRIRSPMVLKCINDFLNGNHHPLDLIHNAQSL